MRKSACNSMDSRLRGNDVSSVFATIPAGMVVRTARAGTLSSVIPAKAGIHAAFTEHECLDARLGAVGAYRTDPWSTPPLNPERRHALGEIRT